jgi:hypothetical protein
MQSAVPRQRPLDIGRETGTTVASESTTKGHAFTGKIRRVRLDTGADDHDHLISPAAVATGQSAAERSRA